MIISMKRIALIAHKADQEAILKALQATSAVQIIDVAGEDAAEDDPKLSLTQSNVNKLGGTLKTVRPYVEKKGMLAARPEAALSDITGQIPGAIAFSDQLEGLSRELASVKSELEKNESVMESLRVWKTFPGDMMRFQTAKNVHYFIGLIAAADVERINEIEVCTEYQFFGDGMTRPCVIACAKEEAKSVANFLKSLAWTDFAFPKLPGTPGQVICQLEAANQQLQARHETLSAQIAKEASGNGELIENAYDAAVIERDRAQAAAELMHTSATFQLEGWVPEDKLQAVERAAQSVTDAYSLTARDPLDDEIPPSYVENSKFSEPFEQVTNLYSRPDPKGLDATPYMAPFYVLLFGLMLSDTGYGLILALGCALYIKLKKPAGMSGGFARVLLWGGLSTIVWGVLVGTFFGMDFDVLFGTTDRFPLLIDPMSDPISMLILCFGLGVLHILFGVGLKMKMSFSQGDWQTAVFDNFSWMLIIIGLLGLAVPSLKTVGMIMAIVGALMILLFKGRAKKNVFGRTISGLGELYQVTGFLSDILSYARLFALGIATGVIASVFNDLCGMLMGAENIFFRILGIAVAIVLLVALHLFNIGINTLGAFVHCARLQYVEFYGKFYETGGREFRPLRYQTRHVSITGE